MNQIVLMDCGSVVSKTITGLLSDACTLRNQNFGDSFDLHQTRMILMEATDPIEAVAAKVIKIRKSCCFRPIPIIVIKAEDNIESSEILLGAGATEVLALDAPPAACRQILQGHLIPNRKPLDKEMAYLTPFIENTITVLSKMAFVETTFREVFFSNDLKIFGEISGIIGLSGTSEGTVAITFYWDLARKIIANMMNVPMDKINAEYIHDGAGELINMISGSTKKRFKGTPFHFDLSLPTVVVGSGHQLGHPEGASIAVLIFDVGSESFILQVCLKPKNHGD
ncbi:MAG: chemotaxis protein CheX [Desulfobacteraceae bacterium]|nr:chemotaxis protein CheX [Desulfobacteraceae bacterium]